MALCEIEALASGGGGVDSFCFFVRASSNPQPAISGTLVKQFKYMKALTQQDFVDEGLAEDGITIDITSIRVHIKHGSSVVDVGTVTTTPVEVPKQNITDNDLVWCWFNSSSYSNACIKFYN